MTPRTDSSSAAPIDLPSAARMPEAFFNDALRQLLEIDRVRYRRLWSYYRNPMTPAALGAVTDNPALRPYRQGQEWGLPPRITGFAPGETDPAAPSGPVARKEVVIENDIGWRVDAMVDHLFGRPVLVTSAADDPARRAVLSDLIAELFEVNGSLAFLQQLAVLGAVFGFVDVVVKLDVAAADALRAELGDTAWSRLLSPPGVTDASGDTRQHRANANANANADADTASAPRAPSTDRTQATPRSASRSVAQALPAGDGALTDSAASEATPPGGDARGAGESGTGEPLPEGGVPERTPHDLKTPHTGSGIHPDRRLLERLARLVRFEIVHPSRALPLPPHPVHDTPPLAYAQVWEDPAGDAVEDRASSGPRRSWWRRALTSTQAYFNPDTRGGGAGHLTDERHVELLTPAHWFRYVGGRLTASGVNSLGRLPLVHIQNLAAPFEYAGRGDVEPLIPLQDELNTRLSDRAHRITMCSFKMFLGKGVEHFLTAPVAPGRIWSTDNPDAEIDEFGGDDRCPSEEQHIAEVREALDKASAVPPVAAGLIRDRVGQLSSAAALRVTLQALLAKTERKRSTYGRGIAQITELALAWLDLAGLLPTTPDERRVRITWPSALPENSLDRLREAEIKARLGVPKDQLLREIGY